nr:hypothetical protein [Tanacetum cinerariifolium]
MVEAIGFISFLIPFSILQRDSGILWKLILVFPDLKVIVSLSNLITALAVVKNDVPKIKGFFSFSFISRITKSTGNTLQAESWVPPLLLLPQFIPNPQPQSLGTTFKARVRDYMAAHTEKMKWFENAIFKHQEEINNKMTEMFGLLKELMTSRAPEKKPLKDFEKENEDENETKNKPIKSTKKELTQTEEEEEVEAPSSQPVGPNPQPQSLGTTFKARVRDYMAAHTEKMERFENAIFKHQEEINNKMTEMFGLLKELMTSRAPEKGFAVVLAILVTGASQSRQHGLLSPYPCKYSFETIGIHDSIHLMKNWGRKRGDGVAGFKRRRRDLCSDDVEDLKMASGRNQLKSNLEDSTW